MRERPKITMANPTDTRKLLRDLKLAPHKKLGQNFLVNKKTAEKIVRLAGVKENDTIIELGVGLGALTNPIAEKAREVIGFEIDSGIVALHREHQDLAPNVRLIHQDILQADFKALAEENGSRLKILANLPYSVSSPLLFRLIDFQDHIKWAVLMLQKEVAQRLTAATGSKDYGILSVVFNSCASVESLMDVGPGQFHPRPKVDSRVVRIVFDPRPERLASLPDFDRALLRRIVRAAFQQRRKTLINALSAGVKDLDKTAILETLARAAIPPNCRAENVTVEHYISLTRAFSEAL